MKGLTQVKAIFRYINNHPLAGRHRLKAYAKFFKWQISQFINPVERKMAFTGKTSLLVKKGMAGATGNIYTGLHEFSDMSFLLHFLRKNDLFADIGANIGSYTVLASGHVGAKTISFEPLPETFKQLQKNIGINRIEQVSKIYNIGIGSERTRLSFTAAYDTVNHVVPVHEKKDNGAALIEVEVYPLDSITKEEGIPVLIKIDVEGFETEVIRGMKDTLGNVQLKAIIIELNGSGGRYGYDEALIHQTLLSNGFKPYGYDAFLRRLDLQEGYGSHNTLYLRDMDFVNDRIKTADKVFIFSDEF